MGNLSTPSAIVARLREKGESSPRLVWYGPDGRIELSGRVLDNWVAKTANLLVDELDAGAGSRIVLDLPVHWKTMVWALAAWEIGATVSAVGSGSHNESIPDGGASDGTTVLVSASGTASAGDIAASGTAEVHLVLVELGALALRWSGALPADAMDYMAEVRSQGDVFMDQAPLPAGRSLLLADRQFGFDALVELGGGRPPVASVVLMEATRPLEMVLGSALAVWQADGTLVLVGPGVPVTDSLLAGERVTERR